MKNPSKSGTSRSQAASRSRAAADSTAATTGIPAPINGHFEKGAESFTEIPHTVTEESLRRQGLEEGHKVI